MKKDADGSLLQLSSAPHIRTGESIPLIMWIVVLSLLPAVAYSVYIFGINAFIVIAVSILSAVGAEAIVQFLLKKPVTVMDGSAVITGLLVAMNVPPMAPAWMVGIGSAFAIIIVKQLFGGLGFNIFNPALAARAFLMASWPVHMTTGWYKFAGVNVLSNTVQNTTGLPQKIFDSMTQATPMSLLKEGPRLLNEHHIAFNKLQSMLLSPEMLKSMFFGNIGGCIGETSAMLLLIGALVLLFRKIITWHIPVSFIGTVVAMAAIYYAVIGHGVSGGYPVATMVLMHILSGGLFLGAFFMATDMVTSPVSAKGMLIFGAGCGFITFVIRIWGGYPEGVSYSILLMNAIVPLIDRYTKPKVFGTAGQKTTTSAGS